MITSRQNRRLKDIRRLRRSKGDWALLEGEHLVAEALACGLPLGELLVTPQYLASSAGQALARRVSFPPLEVDAAALASLADADSPQGVLATAELPRLGAEELPVVEGGVYVYADAVQDPGNLGALARVAEAAGAAALALAPGTVHPNHPRALRASAGSLLRVPTAREVTPEALARRLRPIQARWVCLLHAGGESLYQADLSGALVVALGAEGPGVSQPVLDRAELRITIPLRPPVESLNVTVAAALTLFEAVRRGGAPA